MMYRKFLGIFALITTISILAGCAQSRRLKFIWSLLEAERGAKLTHR